jgi:chemotaxis signal transduction protein
MITTTHRLFSVRVPGMAHHRFALPAEQVVAVLDGPQVYPVPLTPPWVRGLLRHQRDLITLLDLAALLEGHPPPAEASHALVVQAGPGRIAWATTAEATLLQVPGQLPTIASPLSQHPLVAAVLDLDGGLPLALLDLTALPT